MELVLVGGSGGCRGNLGMICSLFYVLLFPTVAVWGNVVMNGRNGSLAFTDIEANFVPQIKSTGECGVLYPADPLDACSPLTNEVVDGLNSSFALIIRGGCTFDKKVMTAQRAGFRAAIVYNNEDNIDLIEMSGDPEGIRIYAVFITKASGEMLKKFAGVSGIQLWIIPSYGESTWSTLATPFITLVAVMAFLATFVFVCRHHFLLDEPEDSNVPEFHGMNSQLVKAMPSLIFTKVQQDDYCTSITCAICLEDYCAGDNIRVLPCRHKFHASCVDVWLTGWRTFCPVCKRDARTSIDMPPASECTPLLSADPSPAASTSGLSSFPLPVAASPAIPITHSPSHTPFTSRSHSLSSSHILHQLRSYNNSPSRNISRSIGSSIGPRNMSLRSYAPYLTSSNFLALPLSSPVASGFASPRVRSSGYGSPSYLAGSSNRLSLHNGESVPSFSALSSAQSLPEC